MHIATTINFGQDEFTYTCKFLDNACEFSITHNGSVLCCSVINMPDPVHETIELEAWRFHFFAFCGKILQELYREIAEVHAAMESNEQSDIPEETHKTAKEETIKDIIQQSPIALVKMMQVIEKEFEKVKEDFAKVAERQKAETPAE